MASLSAVSVALLAISAATTVTGAVVAERNAKAEAKQLKLIGKAEQEDRRRKTRRLIAAQQVAFARAGVATTLGTPLDVLGDTVAEEELAALRIRFGRKLESSALKRRGNQVLIQGVSRGLGTILGGVG